MNATALQDVHGRVGLDPVPTIQDDDHEIAPGIQLDETLGIYGERRVFVKPVKNVEVEDDAIAMAEAENTTPTPDKKNNDDRESVESDSEVTDQDLGRLHFPASRSDISAKLTSYRSSFDDSQLR